MFDRWSESARRVIFFARHEAGALGADSIGPDHMLLGLLRVGSQTIIEFSPEATAATAQPLLSDSVRDRVREALLVRQTRNKPLPDSADMLLAHATKQVLAGAETLRKIHQHANVRPIHVLCALLSSDSIRQELEAAGADLANLKERLNIDL